MKLLFNTNQAVSSKKGYTLLFAVIVSVLVLSIAAFILSVSRKQMILSSSARDSVYAFYAADSGLECAIEHLNTLASSTDTTSTVNCANNDWNVTRNVSGTNSTSTFSMSTNSAYDPTKQKQSGISSCASTTIAHFQISAATYKNITDAEGSTVSVLDSPAEYKTTIESRGYNIGWNGSNCDLPGPRKVERALRYTQYQ